MTPIADTINSRNESFAMERICAAETAAVRAIIVAETNG
jgi:hypothetical protein